MDVKTDEREGGEFQRHFRLLHEFDRKMVVRAVHRLRYDFFFYPVLKCLSYTYLILIISEKFNNLMFGLR